MRLRPELLTIGHGNADRGGLAARLHESEVQVLVDVRRFPGSRHNPDVTRESLSTWLPATGILYVWEERLGGRRTLPADEPTYDDWWRNDSFRAYAAHTRTQSFRGAMRELIDRANSSTTAIMCSETVWWRCHRRIIADVAMLVHDVPVRHLMPDGRSTLHVPSAGARPIAPAQLAWQQS